MSAQHWSLRLFMATVALAGFAAVFNARVAYLLGADNSIGPLLSRLRGA
jgi:hypothetical protein